MIQKPNFLIIGSTGRNSGKTEFACRVIEHLSPKIPVVGVKIVAIEPTEGKCPRGGDGCGVCSSLKGDFEITEEKMDDTGKDTSRMLKAGAQKVYFLKVAKKSLELGLTALIEQLPENAFVICESNSIRNVVKPGLFIVIKNSADNTIKKSCSGVIHLADKIIGFNHSDWDLSPQRVNYENDSWIFKEKASAIILAGGKSSRMGGEDKSFLLVHNIPIIQHIINQLENHFDEIIIGTNNINDYARFKKRIIPDIEKDKGPLMGLYSCLKQSCNEINFITACDIPVMNLSLIHNMINLAKNAEVIMPVAGQANHEPLFAIYNKSVTVAAEKVLNENGRRIIEILKYATCQYVDFSSGTWYQNLNHKHEYLQFIGNNKSNICQRYMD